MEIKDKIKDVLTGILKIKPDELKEDAKLYDDIGVDSTEAVEIITSLEKTFNVELGDKEITKFSSINDIEKIIQAKLNK